MSESMETAVTQQVSDGISGKALAVNFFGGALAGVVSDTFLYPLDFVKTRTQSTTTHVNQLTFIKEVMKQQGPKGFYRGLPTALQASIPTTAIYFTVYEVSKDRIVDFTRSLFGQPPSQNSNRYKQIHNNQTQKNHNSQLSQHDGPQDPKARSAMESLIARSSSSSLSQPIQPSVSTLLSSSLSSSPSSTPSNPSSASSLSSLSSSLSSPSNSARSRSRSVVESPEDYFMPVENSVPLCDSLGHFLAGALGDSAASVIGTPLEIVKQRMQLSTEYQYRSTLHGIASIFKSNGLKGCYAGYTSMLSRDVMFSGMQFMFYERAKASVANIVGKRPGQKLDISETAAASCFAGGMSAFLTSPLDLIKTRLMTQMTGSTQKYQGVIHAFRTVLKEEGIRAFWKGSISRCLWIMPSTAFLFATFEMVKGFNDE